jgi:hypothetical protein
MLPDEAAALPLRRGLIQSDARGRVVILRKTNGGSYHLISVEVDAMNAHGVESKQESLKGFKRHIEGTENLIAERVTFSLVSRSVQVLTHTSITDIPDSTIR